MKLECPTEPYLLSLVGGDVTLAGYHPESACLCLRKCPHNIDQGPAAKVQLSGFFPPAPGCSGVDEMGTDTKEGEVHSGCCVTGVQASEMMPNGPERVQPKGSWGRAK